MLAVCCSLWLFIFLQRLSFVLRFFQFPVTNSMSPSRPILLYPSSNSARPGHLHLVKCLAPWSPRLQLLRLAFVRPSILTFETRLIPLGPSLLPAVLHFLLHKLMCLMGRAIGLMANGSIACVISLSPTLIDPYRYSRQSAL